MTLHSGSPALIILAFGVAFAAPIVRAEEPMLDPDVAFVTTGGYWSGGEVGGIVRVIVVNGGLEHVSSRVFVQWVANSRARGSWVVESAPIAAINDPGVWSVGQPMVEWGDEVTKVRLAARNPYDGSAAEFVVTVRQPGVFDLENAGEIEDSSANQTPAPDGFAAGEGQIRYAAIGETHRKCAEETDLIPAWNLEEIVGTLAQAFERRYPEGGIRLVGLLFAPPESNLGESEITKSLNYFHHRSGDKIDFFCAGYRRYGKAKEFVVEREVTSDSDPWYFNVIDFEALRKETQKNSSWKYSGEADLILLNATKSESGQGVVLDWSSAICCDLEKMKKDKAIESARRFFEDIFIFVDEYDGTDPVWDLSDHQGAIKAKSGLKRLILSVLPKPLRELYSEAKHLVVRDISRGQPQPYLLTELRRNGDIIVVIEHLLRSADEHLPEDLTAAKLSDQLENLLSVAEIRMGAPLNENVEAITTHPIIALRAAVVAVRLARKVHVHSPQQALSLNLLRRDILFGVTGIDQTLEQDAIKRCTSDYEKITYCLVGALSDVASSSPESEKREAMERYSRLCSIVF